MGFFGGDQTVVRRNSTGSNFTRGRVNLIEGTNISLTVADDSTDNEVDVTIAGSGAAADTFVDVGFYPDTSATTAWDFANTNGTRTQNSTGLRIDSSATGGSYSFVYKAMPTGLATVIWASNIDTVFGASMYENGAGTDYDLWWGVGEPTVAGTGITFSDDQAGFKRVGASSVNTSSVTNGNGTTETATSYTDNSNGLFTFVADNGTDIEFRRNTTLVATHTTNLPNGNAGSYFFGVAVSNKSVASNSAFTFNGVGVSVRNR